MTIETTNLRKVIRELIKNTIRSGNDKDHKRSLMLQEISMHISEYMSAHSTLTIEGAIEKWIKNEAHDNADLKSRRNIARIALKKFPPVI